MADSEKMGGFRVARVARDRYGFEDELISERGHVLVSDYAAAQRVAHAMSAARDQGPVPEASIGAGVLHGAGLLQEVAQLVIDAYKEHVGANVFGEAFRFVAAEIGAELVDGTMRRFVSDFPPTCVYRGEERPETYLLPRRDMSLEELMLLWLANENPAYEPFRELFHDEVLRDSTAYSPAIEALDRFFADRPGPQEGESGESLLALLKAPAAASPTSIFGQLDFIRRNWGGLLGRRLEELTARLLRALDVIQEEQAARAPGGEFAITGADLRTRSAMAETEGFSPDSSWMPEVVLLAKSTYVWLDQLARAYGREIHRLDQIPDEELDRIAGAGFTALWLIGVWERSEASRRIKQIRGAHDAAASAYALHDYVITAELGGQSGYENLRNRAAKRGIRLACDMVPNHVGIDGRWVIEHPHWFLSLEEPPYPAYSFTSENLSSDPRATIRIEDHYWDGSDAAVVFQRIDNASGETRYIYHGNDGTVTPWNDTAQLDYLDAEVREGVIQTILHTARMFPIIRFDAAMTLAKRHIQRLWYPAPGAGGAIPSRSQRALSDDEFHRLLPVEFWREVVDRVAAEAPETLLLAEAFWLMENYFVRTLGMHRVYNSAFMHLLASEDNVAHRAFLCNTLEFDPEVLKRYVNFLTNPDEETAVDQFGQDDKYFGAATVLATMPGLPMFGHGQLEGFGEKYGMEFRRARRHEAPDERFLERHRREIFPLLHRRRQFAGADRFLLYDVEAESVFAYSNRLDDATSLILYNNRYEGAAGHVHQSVVYRDKAAGVMRRQTLAEGLGLRAGPDDCTYLSEQRSGLEYLLPSRQIAEHGLWFSLQGYDCQVFLDIREIRDDEEMARLGRRLGGRGVPSVRDALIDMRMEPLHRALRDVVAAAVSAERVTGAEVAAAHAAFAEVLQSHGHQAAPRTRMVETSDRNAGDDAHLPAALAASLPGETWRRAVIAASASLQGVDAASFEEWRLTPALRDAFATAGFADDADRMARLVPLLTRYGDWPSRVRPARGPRASATASTAAAVREMLASLLADPEVRSFLEVHEDGGVEWFDREAFRALRSGLIVAALAETRAKARRKHIARMADALAEAEEQSEYRVDRLSG